MRAQASCFGVWLGLAFSIGLIAPRCSVAENHYVVENGQATDGPVYAMYLLWPCS